MLCLGPEAAGVCGATAGGTCGVAVAGAGVSRFWGWWRLPGDVVG